VFAAISCGCARGSTEKEILNCKRNAQAGTSVLSIQSLTDFKKTIALQKSLY